MGVFSLNINPKMGKFTVAPSSLVIQSAEFWVDQVHAYTCNHVYRPFH